MIVSLSSYTVVILRQNILAEGGFFLKCTLVKADFR